VQGHVGSLRCVDPGEARAESRFYARDL
jgi:hypothetical protein